MPRPTILFLAIPTATILLSTYLYTIQLPPSLTASHPVKTTIRLPISALSSPTLKIINPRSRPSRSDHRAIHLPTRLLPPKISDSEILARFTRGLFDGWVFWPEKMLIRTRFGQSVLPVGFTNVENGGLLNDPSEISRSENLEKHDVLMGWFMVLDRKVHEFERDDVVARRKDEGEEKEPIFIEFGYGDDRKSFAGMHRFEIVRCVENGEEVVKIGFSGISCNPNGNMKFVWPLWKFHDVYARLLFRDGIKGVLEN